MTYPMRVRAKGRSHWWFINFSDIPSIFNSNLNPFSRSGAKSKWIDILGRINANFQLAGEKI
jgi:hypothetical protein